jgi:hypothetical protein
LIPHCGLKATSGPARGHKPVWPSQAHGLACLAQRPNGLAQWGEGAHRRQGSPGEHSGPKMHTRGKVAGLAAHRKGAEVWRVRFTCGDTVISVLRCSSQPGAAPVARRAEPKVRTAPGPGHEEAQPVVRAGNNVLGKGKQGRSAARLSIKETRPAMRQTNGTEGPPYRQA